MKKVFIVFFFLIMTSSAFAGGYRCRAICISLVPDQQSLTFLGFAKQAADMTREEVFDATQEQCVQKANRQGYDISSVLLVNQISFSSSSHDRWVLENDGSSHGVAQADQSVSGNWYGYNVSQQGYAEADSSYHNYYEHEHDQSLSANPDFSYPKDCRFDKNIKVGTQPTYTGDKKFYP